MRWALRLRGQGTAISSGSPDVTGSGPLILSEGLATKNGDGPHGLDYTFPNPGFELAGKVKSRVLS